jgi:hypothetical protein
MTLIRTLLALLGALIGMLLVVPALALGLPFWIIGILTRCLAPLCSPQVVRWPQLFQFDPTLGWRAKSHLDCHCFEERSDVFHVVTDEHGWPKTTSLAESQVVVFGDSHAFGYGTNHASTFFALNTQIRIKAIAAPGYSLVQEFLLMQKLCLQLKGKLVVWLIYTGNDLQESLFPEMSGYRAPFVRRANGSGNWEIVTSHLSPAKWTASASSRPQDVFIILDALHNETFLAERAYSACGFLLKEARRISREAGFTLVVMSVPAPFLLTGPDGKSLSPYVQHFRKPIDADFPDRKISSMCRSLEIPFVPLRHHLHLLDYWERDDHWTEGGHRKVAAVLGDAYRRYGVPSTPSST